MNPLTLSTLACPSWSIKTIVTKAAQYGYGGIEWRGGLQGHVQPTITPTEKSLLRKLCSDAGLTSLAVTAYTSFVSDSAGERQSNIDELRRYADLAEELGAQYIRAFFGGLPEGVNLDSAIYDQISDCLNVVLEHAESMGITIAVEPHDNFVRSSTILPILRRVQHSALRVIWDVGNTFAVGEEPTESFTLLKAHLAYIHVKDGKGRLPNWQLCLLGQGDVPLNQIFESLLANNYLGAFSVEWEYAWHPELEPPEIALPAAFRTVKKLLAAAQPESA